MKYDLKEPEPRLSPSMCTGIYLAESQIVESPEGTIRPVRYASVFTEGFSSPQHHPEGHSRQNLCPDGDKPAIATQVFASLVIGLMQLNVGFVVAFSGITLPQLTNPDEGDLLLTPLQQAFYGSFLFLGHAVGCLASVPLTMIWGNRVTQMLSLVVLVVSWLLLAFSPSVWVLLTSLVFTGLTIGALTSCTAVYILEIAHHDIRGALIGSIFIARQVGILLASVVGISSLSWRQMGFVYSGITVLPFFGLFFLPNSPRWLVTRGRVSEAQKALIFFRGKYYDIQPELKAITDQLENSNKSSNNYWQPLQVITKPSVFRLFVIMVCFMIVISFEGSFSLTSYLMPIFQTMKTRLDPYICSIIFSVVRLVGNFFFFCLTDHLGRRPLIIVSYSVCAVCLAACGGYFYLQESGRATGLDLLPLSAVFIFIFCIGIGQPVIILLSGELMPTSFRAVGFSLLNMISSIGIFAATMTYPATAETLGEHGAFWLFSVVCSMIALVSALTLPETRGRSLEVVSDHH